MSSVKSTFIFVISDNARDLLFRLSIGSFLIKFCLYFRSFEKLDELSTNLVWKVRTRHVHNIVLFVYVDEVNHVVLLREQWHSKRVTGDALHLDTYQFVTTVEKKRKSCWTDGKTYVSWSIFFFPMLDESEISEDRLSPSTIPFRKFTNHWN